MYSTGTAHQEQNVYKLEEARQLIEAEGNDALRNAYLPSRDELKEKEEQKAEQDQSATLAGTELGVRSIIALTDSSPLPSIADFAAKRIAAITGAAA